MMHRIKMVTDRFYMCYTSTADLKLAPAWSNGTWDDASVVHTAYSCDTAGWVGSYRFVILARLVSQSAIVE